MPATSAIGHSKLTCHPSTGTAFENRDTKDVLLKFARDPNHAATFNYASMAHNNHFFFQGLSPTTTAIPDVLSKELIRSFSSLETLRQELTITAASMFGPGFVWIVMDRQRKFSILTTYMAGSPYPAAHYRRQPTDMNTEDKSVSDAVRRMNREPVSNSVGSHGPLSKNQGLAPGGADIIPVLCVNTWEHVYLVDYGVGAYDPSTGTKVGGKRAFVEEWWNKIDWNVVADRASSGSRLFAH